MVNILTLLLMIKLSSSLLLDSHLDYYSSTEYTINDYKDIFNTTWKETVIADKLTKMVKCQPLLIDTDYEKDLLVLDSKTRLYWVSNLRGTSGSFSHHFISKSKLLNFVVNGDATDRDNFYILGINSQENKILKFKSTINVLNQTLSWSEDELFDLNNPSINFIIKDNLITGFNLYTISSDRQVRL